MAVPPELPSLGPLMLGVPSHFHRQSGRAVSPVRSSSVASRIMRIVRIVIVPFLPLSGSGNPLLHNALGLEKFLCLLIELLYEHNVGSALPHVIHRGDDARFIKGHKLEPMFFSLLYLSALIGRGTFGSIGAHYPENLPAAAMFPSYPVNTFVTQNREGQDIHILEFLVARQ